MGTAGGGGGIGASEVGLNCDIEIIKLNFFNSTEFLYQLILNQFFFKCLHKIIFETKSTSILNKLH